jgi:hypothetical protein
VISFFGLKMVLLDGSKRDFSRFLLATGIF